MPSDPCALLTPETISKTLKHTYGAPEKQTAPRPFPNTNEGTDCIYGGSRGVIFRIYVDPSPSASADLFAKLKSFFGTGSTAVSGVGDEAYLDKNKGLHVRKGKVRYFIDGTGSPEQKNELAKAVAAQL